MGYVELKRGGDPPVWLWADPNSVEPAALNQLAATAALPYVHHHVAAMPDVHLGRGATIGSVIPMLGAVAPCAVGVDIGCGMTAVETNLRAEDLPDDLGKIRAEVEAAIPVGRAGHDGFAEDIRQHDPLWLEFGWLHPSVQSQLSTAQSQLGTLGGGNHFIEMCVTDDETRTVWLVLHSGSRGIGNKIAQAHIKIAQSLEHNKDLQDPNLAVILSNTPEMDAYRDDLYWAQDYAAENRRTMVRLYLRALRVHLPHLAIGQVISCHHNYVAEEIHFGEVVLLTRKGAISAKADQFGIIPGSMGTGSFIVQGLGNPNSFNSAPHGAGRRMSRSAARKTFTLEHLIEQTRGVEVRQDAGLIDEIPGAYKDIDDVMQHSRDLVRVVHKLNTVMCVKG
jgi:tRNA-splicing ligase RtcB